MSACKRRGRSWCTHDLSREIVFMLPSVSHIRLRAVQPLYIHQTDLQRLPACESDHESDHLPSHLTIHKCAVGMANFSGGFVLHEHTLRVHQSELRLSDSLSSAVPPRPILHAGVETCGSYIGQVLRLSRVGMDRRKPVL